MEKDKFEEQKRLELQEKYKSLQKKLTDTYKELDNCREQLLHYSPLKIGDTVKVIGYQTISIVTRVKVYQDGVSLKVGYLYEILRPGVGSLTNVLGSALTLIKIADNGK